MNSLRCSLSKSDYIEGIRGGHIKRLGIVANADSPAQDHAGFNNRWSQLINQDLKEIMEFSGIAIPATKTLNQGEVFSNADDSLRIGFWLMPNHRDDGCLEDLVLACAKWDSPLLSRPLYDQHTLKNCADSCLRELDEIELKLFANHRLSKASAYTWLAWQTKPTQFLSGVIEEGLLDMQHPYVLAFKDWIEKCFK